MPTTLAVPSIRKCSLPFSKDTCFLVLMVAILAAPRRAEALVNVGADVGLVKRSADSPGNLSLGVGYGFHGELALLPLLSFGPYYLHSELSSADANTPNPSGFPIGFDGVFNTLGLRARFTLPIPGSYKPYAFACAGYSWVKYAPLWNTLATTSGHFIETPVGAGIAYEIVEIFQLSFEAAYRPGFSFGGDAYDVRRVPNPKSGWSVMLGASLNL